MFVHISWTLTPQWLLVRHSIYVLDSFERVLIGKPLKLIPSLTVMDTESVITYTDLLLAMPQCETSVEWILVISLDEGTRKKVRFCVL